MSIYSQARKAWEDLEIGQKITANQLLEKLGLDQTARATVSSFLSRELSKGQAIKEGKREGFTLYKKVAPAEARKERLSREERELTDRDIGNAVLKVIDNLKAELRSEKEIVKDLVEENKQLKQIYDQAQAKILELNQELQKREPTREVKLSELRELGK